MKLHGAAVLDMLTADFYGSKGKNKLQLCIKKDFYYNII